MRQLLTSILAVCAAPAWAEPVDFSRDVQPILSENCYHCHGPDPKTREGQLRLDTREGAYRTLDGVTVVKPGDPANSELIVRIFSQDQDEVMPTPKSHRTLTEAQKQTLRRWVEEGAPWGEHWAFVPPKKAAVPEGENPIDHFVRKKLAQEKLSPAPEAAPEDLIRRVTMDLTGLPPTLEAVDAFVADPSEAAYAAHVDRLLASPRYGERMVWEWLDAARYADTNGYQGDPTRAMWYWRDWAIAALNDNLPFDQFTIEQLAGDLLEKPTQAQLIATGFHRNHMLNGEGGRIAEETRVENVMDRVETTGTVWLGLTFNCCRCHDHKYDQLTQRDYYQLAAYFNSIDETGANDAGGLAHPILTFATPEQKAKIDALKAAEDAAKRTRDELEKKLRAEQAEWERTLLAGADGKAPAAQWTPLVPTEANAEQGTVLTKADDGSVLAVSASPAKDEYVVIYPATLAGITAFKLEVLPDASLPHHGPGRAPENGNFVLSEVALQDYGKNIPLSALEATFEQTGWPAAKAFDGDPKTGWAIMGGTGKTQTLLFTPGAATSVGSGHNLAFRFSFAYGRQHTLGKFRLSATTDNAALLRPMPENIRALLAKPAGERSDAEKGELTKYYLDTSAALTAARKARDDAKAAREAAEKAIPRTMIMRDREKPRDTFILTRGAYDKPSEKVGHGTPAFLPPLPTDAPKNRLALTRWLVSAENPLTARVVVNRFWQQFFGRGLVKTVDDFGVQGDKPTHPELLDWLAVDFREHGWDVKRLVRQIVTSATYRQASHIPPGLAERDPENKLLARGPRHRWPSWMLRDQALALGGLLVEKIGGPPVKGYQPPGVWEEATFGQITYQQDKGEALYRRSLYTFWRRIVGPTYFFDVSNRQTCSVKTGLTNTPLHALTTLNDVTYTEAARAFAQRVLKSGGDDAARLTHAFRLCTARQPAENEMAILQAALARLRQSYHATPDAAQKLIAIGESKPDPQLAPAELAAWTALGTLLLNLDETLSKE
jgi:hypothetical protein